MSIDIAVVDFALGSFHVTVDDGVVRAATFDRAHSLPQRDESGVYDALVAYFAGDVAAIDAVATDGAGTSFQREVWAQLRRIPVGSTISYGELARRVGRPQAQRAVGAANGANPIALIVPCHRVVRTGGAIGGYAYGLAHKRWLLAHEGAPVGPVTGARNTAAHPIFDDALFDGALFDPGPVVETGVDRSLLHGDARHDDRTDAVEDLVETRTGDRQAVIA